MHALCFRITPALMGRALSQWECFKHIVIVWCLCLYVTSSQPIDCSEISKSIWGFGEFVILQPLVFANVCNLSSIVICWCFNWNWCENHNSSIITYSLHSSSGKHNHKNYHTPILFGCSGFDGPVFFTWQGVMQCPWENVLWCLPNNTIEFFYQYSQGKTLRSLRRVSASSRSGGEPIITSIATPTKSRPSTSATVSQFEASSSSYESEASMGKPKFRLTL